jgi:hypothetical protein
MVTQSGLNHLNTVSRIRLRQASKIVRETLPTIFFNAVLSGSNARASGLVLLAVHKFRSAIKLMNQPQPQGASPGLSGYQAANRG